MSTTTKPTCSVCGKELEYAGRGRPPTKCDEHKNVRKSEGSTEMPTPRPRPRPGQSKQAEAKAETPAPKEQPQEIAPRQRPGLAPVGKADTQSRSKAETAKRRTESQVETVDSETWPRGENGRPMAKITMTASELVPTGQYANVSVGPAQITTFVDLDRETNGSYFNEAERDVISKALNELAEVVERDVIAVQRALVLESMQEQLAS